MARNASWDRWVYASVAKHLRAAISSEIVFDFGGKRTSAWENADHRVEVTIGGFRTQQINHDTYKVECEVFAIVSSNLTSNNYSHVDVVGDVANALDQCVTVIDYGATGAETIGLLRGAKGSDQFVAPDHIKPKQTDDRLHSTAGVKLEGRFKT
jgi:hypothetical protein